MLAAAALSSLMITTSCSEDEDFGSTAITVDKVFLQDAASTATVHNREVDFARLGQTIRIQGKGFNGLRHIYVNGYDTYFNNALMTDNNVWVTLTNKIPVVDASEDVRNTIQFVKDGTSYTYNFTIRASSPSIESISCTLPKAGETVVVNGANLHETTSVTLPSGTVITDITSDEDGEWFSFVMPEGETQSGSITSVGANGTAKSPAYFNENTCYIIDYDGLGTQGFWSWSETGSMCNDEDLVTDPLNSGRGNVAMLVPQRLIDNGGIAAGKTRATEWWTAGNDNDADDWTWMMTEGTGLFESTTPLSEIALQFDIYCPTEWTGTGQLQISAQNNVSFNGYGSDESKSSSTQTYVWVPWIVDGEVVPFKTDGWQTVTIPLSKFSKYTNEIEDDLEPTFEEIVTDRNSASYKNFGFGFVNSDITVDGVEYPSSVFTNKVYIDNLRLVPCTAITVSDFPEE